MIIFLLILILIATLFISENGREILSTIFYGIIYILLLPFRFILAKNINKELSKKMEPVIEPVKDSEIEREQDTDGTVVITCGACGTKNRLDKNKGNINIKCSKCQRVSNINT